MNANGMSWPTVSMLETLETGNLEQLWSMWHYLPKAQTTDQEAFILSLEKQIHDTTYAA